MLIAIRSFFLLIVFLSELAALFAYGYWGFRLDHPVGIKVLVGVRLPLLVAIGWGLFLSPKASYEVSAAIRFVLKVFVFGFAAAALYAVGLPSLSFVLGVCVLVAHLMVYVLGDK